MSTREQAVTALVAGFVVFVLALVWVFSGNGSGAGSGDGGLRRDRAAADDPLTQALRYVPRSAGAVAAIDTDTGGGPMAEAIEALGRVTDEGDLGAALDGLATDALGLDVSSDASSLTGSPLVLAATGTATTPKLLAVWAVGDPGRVASVLSDHVSDGTFTAAESVGGATTYDRDDGPGVYAQRGGVLLAADDRDTLERALARGQNRGAAASTGLSPGAFARRAASGVSAKDAVVRLAVEGPMLRQLASRVVPGAGQLPLLAGVTGAGIGVRADAKGLHARIRVRTDESLITEADLPLAPGRAPPPLEGDAPLRVGLRSPAQTGAFLLRTLRLIDPERLKSYEQAKDIFGRVARFDPEGDLLASLTGPATLSRDEDGTLTFRARTTNEDGVRSALERLSGLGRIGNYTGELPLGDVVPALALRRSASGDEDTYDVEQDESPVAVIALRGDVLVASTDPAADVESLAYDEDLGGDGPGGSTGALKLVAMSAALGELLGLPERIRAVTDRAGDVTLTARAELSRLLVALDVGLGG